MASMAQEAMEMGLDPEIAPDGLPWCMSACGQSDASREIWGDLKSDCDNTVSHIIEGCDMTEFKIGDVVQLLSGGPNMTVCMVNGDEVSCRWFNGKTLNSALFNVNELKKEPMNQIHEDNPPTPEIEIDDTDCNFPW